MQLIKNILEKVRPNFEKGGKFEKFYPAYDAFETFLFVPGHTTSSGAHIRDAIDLKRTMVTVIIALLPCLFFGIWNVGHLYYTALGEAYTFLDAILIGLKKVIPLIIVSYGVGLSIEFYIAIKKNHQVNEGYLVTGLLIPLVMPVDVPLWMLAISVAFAVIFGKEVFGGTGMNILNPALTARAFLFFAYPTKMSGDIWVHQSSVIDGISGATALGDYASMTSSNQIDSYRYSMYDMFVGWIPGSIGETSVIAIFIGAAILLITRIGSLRIMLSAILGGLTMGYIFNLMALNPFMEVSATQHLLMGGFMFGVVFMATDPVSGSQTNLGKLIYGFLIGFLGIMIRVFNPAYPEGIMLAILLMNVFAPLIDHYVIEANIKRRLKRIKS